MKEQRNVQICTTCQDLSLYDLFAILYSHGINLSLVFPQKQTLKQSICTQVVYLEGSPRKNQQWSGLVR